MKPVVLVTAIGTVTATAIIKEIKKTEQYHIIGSDINKKEEIATSLDVDEFYTFPPIADLDAYLQFVFEFCREHKVSYYFAVLDKEVVLISKHRKAFGDIGTQLCVVNYEFAEICHYKNAFSEWIVHNMPDIAIRTYKDYSEIKEKYFPLFIKPVEGVARTGCRRIDSLAELKQCVPEDKIGTEILVQDYIQGDNITVDLVRNKTTHQQIQIQRKELLRNANGCGIAVEIIKDGHLQRICDELMEKLDLNGVANAEFFCKEGKYKIIEINPRFSAGSRYTCMAGINTVINALNITQGEPCIFGNISYGKHFAERYEAYQMD